MTEERKVVQAFFGALSGEEAEALVSGAMERSFSAGELLYSQGEDPQGMFLVLEGAVELVSVFSGSFERVFATLRSGQVLGLLSLIDEGPRPATARTIEATRTLLIGRGTMEDLRESRPVAWAKVVAGLGVQMASQIRLLVDQYRQCIEWGREISGCSGLNIDRLLADSVHMEVELLNGSSLTGVIAGVERRADGGYELLFRSDDGKLRIIPDHAVLQIVAGAAGLAPVLAD